MDEPADPAAVDLPIPPDGLDEPRELDLGDKHSAVEPRLDEHAADEPADDEPEGELPEPEAVPPS